MVKTNRVWLVLVFSCASGSAWSQSTRMEELEQRRAKEGGQYEERDALVEKAAIFAEEHKLLDRMTLGIGGVRPVFGNLIPGSGLALGPEYYRDDIKDGAIRFRASVRGSLKEFLLADAELSFPRLLQQKAYLDLYTRWRNYPSVPYYGSGPDSDKNGQTAYRLEDAAHEFGSGFQPLPRMRLGVTGGLLQVNVGPADDSRHASTEQVFPPSMVPGLANQTEYLHGGFLASYDWRNRFGGPKSGGFYEARFDYFHDRDLKRHSHRRLTLEAQQYIPLLNHRRIIALRAKTLLTMTNGNQTVPFYMQGILGGQNDLRGFRFARFYDNNVLALNGEYRWEIFSGLDGALFYDAGKVFPKRSQLNFHDLEGAAGFGLRVNARNNVFLRLDVAFSHEGYRLGISFNDVFSHAGGVSQSLYTSRYREP